MERGDLRVKYLAAGTSMSRAATDADLASLGYVKRPDCPDCDGDGIGMAWPDDAGTEPYPCLSCGGSGYGRLVALDRDRIAHALLSESWQHEATARLYPSPVGWYPFADHIIKVLAALDPGDADG